MWWAEVKAEEVVASPFAPHDAIATGDSYALEIIGDVKEYRDASSPGQILPRTENRTELTEIELGRYRVF